MTKAMKDASKGLIPEEKDWHEPSIKTKSSWTVAMFLANKGIIPPKEWQHDPELAND